MPKGYYSKYFVAKSDGSEVDPNADYFVLRLDTDPAAREALRRYAEVTENKELAKDIRAILYGYDWR